jgi:hypothetical protein
VNSEITQEIYTDYIKANEKCPSVAALKTRYNRLKKKYNCIGIKGLSKEPNITPFDFTRLLDRTFDDKYTNRAQLIAASMFTLSKEQVTSYKSNESKRVYKESTNLMNITGFDTVFKEALQEVDNPSSTMRTMFSIALMTGRRMGEIAYTGKFEPTDNNQLLFIGQLKKGTTGLNEVYTIPCLCNNEKLCSTHKDFKNDMPAFKDTVDMNLHLGKPASRFVKSFIKLGLSEPNTTFHISRALYAKVAWELYGQHSNMNTIGYLSSILGHGSENKLDATVTVQYDSLKIEKCEMQNVIKLIEVYTNV